MSHKSQTLKLLLVLAGILVGAVFHVWFLVLGGAAVLALAGMVRIWAALETRPEWSVVVVSVILGLVCLGAGVYGLAFTNAPVVLRVVLILVLLVPAAYFLLLAWSAAYETVTGKRSRVGKAVGTAFTWASRDLFHRPKSG